MSCNRNSQLSSFFFHLGMLSNAILCVALQVTVPNGSHLASTYSALAILRTVGYNLSLVNSKSILKSMRNLQQQDGR